MSVRSGSTQWVIECDREGCRNGFHDLRPTCVMAMLDAEHEGWSVRADGTAYCPTHRPRE